MNENDINFIRNSIEVAKKVRENGNHPFGAILVDEHGNIGPILEEEAEKVHEGFWK